MIKYASYSLLKQNTFGIDVKADWFVEYRNVEELTEVLRQEEMRKLPLLHIGGGSNLLFMSDFHGLVLHSGIKGIEVVDENATEVLVRVGAGVIWDDFVLYAIEHDWHGIENLSIIPGEVGASAIQNIGAYGVEVKDVIEKVETIEVKSLSPFTFTNAECRYAYRSSVFKQEYRGRYIVTHVVFRLSKVPCFVLEYGHVSAELEKRGLIPTARHLRDVITDMRNSKLPDPKVLGNGGSFFMNPVIPRSHYECLLKEYPEMPCYRIDDTSVKVPAGWLIEKAGWKGRSLGNAGVYEKQALVLVNLGNATGRDIWNLATHIVKSVEEKFAIRISPEVNLIGEKGLI